MCDKERITLFNGTFNSTQVLHKAGGIGMEQETALLLHVQYDFIIFELITLKNTNSELKSTKIRRSLVRTGACVLEPQLKQAGWSLMKRRHFLLLYKN